MKIEKKKFGVSLDLKELSEAIQDFILKKDGIALDVHAIGQEFETVEIPGYDIHDCDYVEKFVGVRCMCTESSVMTIDLQVGKQYWQIPCEKWLTFDGEDRRQHGWYNFLDENGNLYNQLTKEDIKHMFDFQKEK